MIGALYIEEDYPFFDLAAGALTIIGKIFSKSLTGFQNQDILTGRVLASIYTSLARGFEKEVN